MSKRENPNLIKMPVTYDDEYTELVSGGEGITVDKGVISASGGSGGGGLVVNVVNATHEGLKLTSGELDKSFEDINNAFESGIMPVFIDAVNYNGYAVEISLYPQSKTTNDPNYWGLTLVAPFASSLDMPYDFYAESPTGTLILSTD